MGANRFVALVGLRESLYVECSSRPERDWLVAGFRQLLFGAEGRARARALAYGRALEQPRAHSPQVRSHALPAIDVRIS